MDEQNEKDQLAGEALKRELERKSFDTIRVYNPTNEDYILDWDGRKHRIPAKSESSLPRYLAQKYRREMKDKLISDKANLAVAAEKERIAAQGVPADNVTYLANDNLKNQFKTNDPALIDEMYAKVWLGLEHKFGLDAEIPNIETPQEVRGERVDEQIGRKYDDQVYQPEGHTSPQGGNGRPPVEIEDVVAPQVNKSNAAVAEVS